MATSAGSQEQIAQLCNRCAVLPLKSIAVDGILSTKPTAVEDSQEREVDLDWELESTPNSLDDAFGDSGVKCDSCTFLKRVLFWWEIQDRPASMLSAEHVRLSLHYVFRLGKTDKYELGALRIKIRPDSQEDIHVDCPVSAATDSDTGTLLGLKPPLSHIDEETIRWMKSRLESCVSHDHINPQKTFVPDRLIEVGADRLRLVLTKDIVNSQSPDSEIPRYIALTYCWGPQPHADKQLKTTSVNISQYQQEIPESPLPQAIKDSAAVARALSIPFLWVDALCILQDVASDWDKQCAVMERIYGNAYVTVAAASSENCEEGYVTRTDRILLPFQSRDNDTVTFGVYSPLYKASVDEELPVSPWLERGWTFQERITSTRMLMFSKRNIHFKCPSFSESMGRKQETYDADFRMLDRVTIQSGDPIDTYKEWAYTVSHINPQWYHFTRETDLLPSVAGIAALFGKKLDDDYVAGLWKKNLHQCLYWVLSDTKDTRYQALLTSLKNPSPYIAPSWSWASRHNSFWFDLYHSTLTVDCRPEYDDLDAVITLRGETGFGEVRDAALEMTSKVYMGSQRITYHEVFQQITASQKSVRFDGQYFAHIQPDCYVGDLFQPADNLTLATPISFLLIGSTIRRLTDENFFSSRHSDNSVTLGDSPDEAFSDASFDQGSTSDDGGEDSEREDTVERAAFSDAASSSRSVKGSETGATTKRAAYGLLIHPTGNPGEYYRVGTFFSKPFRSGGLSFFDELEPRRVRLV
ncbi:hypothetical protein ACHAPT_008244 [Fusarium lateritium]